MTLTELRLYREIAGMSWSAAEKRLKPRFCATHLAEIAACGECAESRRFCPRHSIAWADCEECPEIDVEAMGAYAFICERRRNPELDWKAFSDSADIWAIARTLDFTRPGESA